ncbi:MAG: enoyl-CoA hydratase/isomerase family protein, partial [Desulfobacterales bacterium]
YAFSGVTISAEDAHALGIANRLVAPAEVEAAIKEILEEGKPDKYRRRDIPARFKPLAAMGSAANVSHLLAGRPVEGVDQALAAKTAKIIGYKAPLALKIANEIIDRQIDKPMEEAIEIELGRLQEIFSTADALEGLTSMGRRKPEYKGA